MKIIYLVHRRGEGAFKKMEKHPIDELFAKKLAEHRQEPSQRALEQFQARIAQREQQKRGGGFLTISHNRRWYYGAAAGLAIALSVVFLSQKNDSKTDLAQSNTKKPTEIVQPKNTVQPIVEKQLANNSIQKIIEKQPIAKPIQQNQIIIPIAENTVSIAQNEVTESKENTIQNTISDHTESTESIATTIVIPETQNTDNQVIMPAESLPLKGVQPQNTVENVEEPVVLASNNQSVENPEMMPMLDEDSVTEFDKLRRAAMEREENSKSFLARLGEEYKHLKYGEKVDLNNLKVKPKEVLARADEQVLRDERNDIKETFYRKVGRFLKN
jgi:hypothetical protein